MKNYSVFDILATEHVFFCPWMQSSDAGHIGPHGMRRCLSFSYKEDVPQPPTPSPRQKSGSFLKSARCAQTSQIPAKMALGRGRFGARGGRPKKLNTSRTLVF